MTFALLVALPALALAITGFGAISAERLERAEQRRQRAAAAASAIDAAVGAFIERTRVADPPPDGVIHFVRESSGVVAFPLDRVYIAGFGLTPASAVGDRASSSAGSNDIPRDIVDVVAGATRAPRTDAPRAARAALAKLRTGTWWLHLDQRRAYDRTLVDVLERVGAGDMPGHDVRLNQLARAHTVIASQPMTAQSGAAAALKESGAAFVTWSRTVADSSIRGAVIDPKQMQAILDAAFSDFATSQGLSASVRDRLGATVWAVGDVLTDEGVTERALAVVDGWSLRVAPLELEAAAVPWRAYGLVGLPLVVLAFGLVTMMRVMRRESDGTDFRELAESVASLPPIGVAWWPDAGSLLMASRDSNGRLMRVSVDGQSPPTPEVDLLSLSGRPPVPRIDGRTVTAVSLSRDGRRLAVEATSARSVELWAFENVMAMVGR